MKEYYFNPDDFAEANINTAQSCLIKANTTAKHDDKIKSLIIACKLIEGTLKSYGIDLEKIKRKNKKK